MGLYDYFFGASSPAKTNTQKRSAFYKDEDEEGKKRIIRYEAELARQKAAKNQKPVKDNGSRSKHAEKKKKFFGSLSDVVGGLKKK